jgi:protein gp37
MPTLIEWARNRDGTEGESWNPIRARRISDGKQGHYCQKIGPGCAHCYAERINLWRGNGVGYTVPGLGEVELYLDEEVLMRPLRWRKPRNVFVCSMTDLFAEFVPNRWIRQIYAVEAMTARHTYMHLTKRPLWRQRFLSLFQTAAEWAEYLSGLEDEDSVYWDEEAECHIANAINGVLAEGYNVGWPMKNVREGVTVCNQKEADELIPILLGTPADVRFISAEPLLEDLNLLSLRIPCISCPDGAHGMDSLRGHNAPAKLDWVIAGCESGPDARDVDDDAFRSLRDQCAEAGAPFFLKQMKINGKLVHTPLLDGVEHKAFPVARP